MTPRPSILLCALVGTLSFAVQNPTAGAATPENLAPKAKIEASSEHSHQYLARYVADGQVPGAMSHADVGKAWCAKGNQHPQGVQLTFTWPAPVRIAEVVYYGRTAFQWEENWKDYELRADAAVGAHRPGGAEAGSRSPTNSLAGADHYHVADAEVPQFLRWVQSWCLGNPGLFGTDFPTTTTLRSRLPSIRKPAPVIVESNAPREHRAWRAIVGGRVRVHETDRCRTSRGRSDTRLHLSRRRAAAGWRTLRG